MAGLQWSEALWLDLPLMDDTHREFVNLLAQVKRSDDAQLPEAWDTLITHTEAHFGQEDAWMQATRFASSNCHSMQHSVVLQVMREGLQAARGGQADALAALRQMAHELGVWFSSHAQSMDAALALHLRRVGYDPHTGVVSAPGALPTEPIHGCGGSCGSDSGSETQVSEQASDTAIATAEATPA